MLEALSSLLGIQATGVAKSREKIAVGGQKAGGFSLERGVELSCFPAGGGHHGLGSHVVTSEETSGWRDTLGDPHGGRLGRAKAVTGTGRACKWISGVTDLIREEQAGAGPCLCSPGDGVSISVVPRGGQWRESIPARSSVKAASPWPSLVSAAPVCRDGCHHWCLLLSPPGPEPVLSFAAEFLQCR